MDTTTVGVDLAKSRIEVAVADADFRVQRCARTLQAQSYQVRLLPALYVRAYVRRNKTDGANAGALIEASRSAVIRPPSASAQSPASARSLQAP